MGLWSRIDARGFVKDITRRHETELFSALVVSFLLTYTPEMEVSFKRKLVITIFATSWIAVLGGLEAFAQPPDVPIYRQGRKESEHDEAITSAAKDIFSSDKAVTLAMVREQLKRTSCHLTLPKVSDTKLSAREICNSARRSHFRVGWSFSCTMCDDWHVNLAGGYVLTADGAMATCYHVIQPERIMKEGCLVAADESGKVYPIKEVIAANRYSDVCIVRVEGQDFKPLALNTNTYPGDTVYCYSDPLDHRGYFSSGIVNRFYQFPGRRPFGAPPEAAFAPTRLNVGTDWAPGSSGSAVLDEFGNAVGNVSTIGVVGDEEVDEGKQRHRALPTMILFHEAVSARDVLLLIRKN